MWTTTNTNDGNNNNRRSTVAGTTVDNGEIEINDGLFSSATVDVNTYNNTNNNCPQHATNTNGVGVVPPDYNTRNNEQQHPAPHSSTEATNVESIIVTIRQWLIQCAWPGLGLFGESYILFGIGTLQPVFQILYPQCYYASNANADSDNNNSNNSSCPTWIVESMTYSVVVGVMVGMVVVGLLANLIGRRRGSILTATLMSFGAVCMAVAVKIFGGGGGGDADDDDDDELSSEKLFMSLSILLFIFGIGVGGEYPLSASSASEKATSAAAQERRQNQQRGQDALKTTINDDKSTPLIETTTEGGNPSEVAGGVHAQQQQQQQNGLPGPTKNQIQQSRGRQIQLVFTMQGMGIWVNTITLMLLLWLTGQTGGNGNDGGNEGGGDNVQYQQYDHQKLLLVTQVTYLIGALVLLFVLVTRYLFLEESQVWIRDKERQDNKSIDPNRNLSMAVSKNKNNETTDREDDSDQIGNTAHEPTKGAFVVETPITVGAVVAPGCDTSISSSLDNRRDFDFAAPTTRRTPPTEQKLSFEPIMIQESTVSELSSPTVVLQQEDYERQIMEDNSSFDEDDDLKSSKLSLLLRNYGVRLFGASASWLLWDISFYGNKLFQASFILALTGEQTTLFQFASAATLNSTVALLGYFGAACLIDRPDIGRVKLQTCGFLVTGTMFVMCGFSFDQLSSGLLVVMYLASSFFGQLGPNATTFTIPAEIFPTEQRTLCHGICASSGKLGALIAAYYYHHVENDADLFLISGYASFAACLISLWTIPETNGLDLLELDIKWRMTLKGRKGDYNGPANHPDHLSMYERWKKGATIRRQHQMPDDWGDYID